MNINRHKLILRNYLEDIIRPITAEIRNYPLPAAGCDAQYNHLLEQRGRLAEELTSLAEIERPEEIDDFIVGSAYINDDAAQKLRRKLNLQSAIHEDVE